MTIITDEFLTCISLESHKVKTGVFGDYPHLYMSIN
jgi:hypothetical protein